jgi:hypothetical protein
MDFGLFVLSGTPTVVVTPTPSPMPTSEGHAFNMGFLESKFFWWCMKLLFWSTVIRDACFQLVPFIGRLVKSAIDKSFPSPDTDVDEAVDEIPEPVENETGASVPKVKSRVKGGAYHYSSALESALGLEEGKVELEIRKGIDVLGDKAEEVVESMAGRALESLLGGRKKE